MPPNALLLHLRLLLLEALTPFDRIGCYLLLFLLFFLHLAQKNRLVEQRKFFYRLLLLAYHILQRRPFLALLPAPFPYSGIFIFEALGPLPNNLQILLALKLIGGALQFFMHLLAETITVPDLGGNGTELPYELNLQQIRHGVKANQQLTLAMFLDALDEEIPLPQQSDDLIKLNISWKGNHQLNLFGLILN